MTVYVRRTGVPRAAHEVPEGSTVQDVLRALGYSSQECIVACGDDIVPADLPIREGMDLMLIRAITGG